MSRHLVLGGLVAAVIVLLGAGCRDVPPAPRSELIIMDMPHGGQRIHVRPDGSGWYTYGALPAFGRFPMGTFDFGEVHAGLAGLVQRDRRDIGGEFGTVEFCSGAGDCGDLLYFYDREYADSLFGIAYRNRLPPRVGVEAAGLQTLDRMWRRLSQGPDDSGPPGPVGETSSCVVRRIVDGDTFECQGLGSIRLIGMDTPELSQTPYGGLAADALATMASEGSRVEIELDLEQRDRYDRLLAHVWADGVLVNWWLVRQGWAVVYTVPPNVQ
ncbi:MAG TPA: thermonuclease family protein, partial [Gemmatimonadota bacterium]|nr:thermonuclease family protein [Gemmatimonadota bacterium]